MFDFFRKYQHYIFIVVTVVIVISFSFFGTYNTIGSTSWREQIAFKAVNGSEITRAEVDEMSIFIATDNSEKMLYGGVWGPNFLNDGVIRKNFLETGIAKEIAAAYIKELESDLMRRHEKENTFKLYTHPQAAFVGVARAWEYFAPDMQKYYHQLRTVTTPKEVFDTKVDLYLSQKLFDPSLLRQVLRFQEKQNSWLSPDPNLDKTDLSLFGYHSIEDWFGSHFTRLISQFIINASIVAESKGYTVSQTEALSDLIRNAEESYQQNINQPNLGVKNLSEYINEQLRRMNMDQSRAIRLWRQVMLFRRYFQDAGGVALVDTITSTQFHGFSKEGLEVDLYRLPSEFRLGDYDSLQKFQVYLEAIAPVAQKKSLALPSTFLTTDQVLKSTPELVQRKYVLEVAEVNKKSLQSKVSVKEMWNWEVQDANWETLKKQFPDLGVKEAKTREERFDALDSLDPIMAAKVQAFARVAIINNHQDWIEKALDEAPLEKKTIGIRLEGGKFYFEGLNDKAKRKDFIALLEKAPLNESPILGSPLYAFSADQEHYYRIKLIERSANSEVLTFAEANSDGTLNQLKDRLLEKYYIATRDQHPMLYQKADKSWKNFSEVRDLVADSYFESINKLLEEEYRQLVDNADVKSAGKDRLASLRFYSLIKDKRGDLEKNHTETAAQSDVKKTNGLEKKDLVDQWKIFKERIHLSRANPSSGVDITEAFALPIQGRSAIKTPANGDLLFYQIIAPEISNDTDSAVDEQVNRVHQKLSDNAQQILTRELLKQIQVKGAISLTYLLQPQGESSSETEINE
jgi:GcvH upstream region-like protein